MCGWALSWKRIEPILLISIACRGCSFQCISSIYWAYLSDVMVLLGFRKLSWSTHLLSFFIFPICFKFWTTIEGSTLSSLETSCVVVRRPVSMILLVGHCQLLMASHCDPHLQVSSPLQNFLNHCCTVRSLAVPRPNVLLMLRVISTS